MGAAGAPMSLTRKNPVRSVSISTCAVLLAGGRGTRFWPRSRMATPKQLLNITGNETMLAQTVGRLEPLFPGGHVWVVTNSEQAGAVAKAAPQIARRNILAEPA